MRWVGQIDHNCAHSCKDLSGRIKQRIFGKLRTENQLRNATGLLPPLSCCHDNGKGIRPTVANFVANVEFHIIQRLQQRRSP